MRDGERVLFCPGECPHLPDGVIAEVSHVRLDAGGQAARVVSTVVESTNAYVEVDAESVMIVDASGKSAEDVKRCIADCAGAKKGRLAKAIGGKGVCQGLQLITHDRA